MSSSPSEVGRMVELNLASVSQAQQRAREGLVLNPGPTTAASTSKWVDWDNMSAWLGQPFDMVSIPLSKLEQMRRDPMIAFALSFVKLPLIRASWKIQSTDAQRAAFIDSALRRIYGRLILAYCNSLDYGYSGIVKRFEMEIPDWEYIDPDDPTQMKKAWTPGVQAVLWKPFTALHPKLIAPSWDSDGNFNGIYYRKGNYGASPLFFKDAVPEPEIPLDWALWGTNEKDSVFGSLWGYPRTGYAYRYWWAYWYRFGQADRAFERWADPPVSVYHPTSYGLDNSGNKVNFSAEALALAEKLRSGANIALPSEVLETIDGRATAVRRWEVKQEDSTVNFTALDESFKYLDIAKVRALMVPEQALVEGRGGSSSRNVAHEFGDLLHEAQALVMKEIDDIINRYLIPQLLAANFGDGASCIKVTTGFDPKDLDTQRTLLQVVGQMHPEKLPVDFRGMLDDLGIPTMSVKAFDKQLEDAAAQAAAMRPQPSGAAPSTAGGARGEAGVSHAGFYFEPRQRIELSVVRVDELPDVEGDEEVVAMYDSESGLLKLRKDQPQEVDAEAIALYQEARHSAAIAELAQKVYDLENRPPEEKEAQSPMEFNFTIEADGKKRRVKKTVHRDEDGNIRSIDEEEIGE